MLVAAPAAVTGVAIGAAFLTGPVWPACCCPPRAQRRPTPQRDCHYSLRLLHNLHMYAGQKKPAPRTRRSKQSEWLTSPINVGILPNLLGYNIRRAQIALWRDFGRTVADGNIRPGMFSVLVLVGANPGIAQVDLARELDQDKATIVGLIDELQRRRCVLRRRSRVDQRRHGIFLTPTGRRRLESLRHEMLEHEARFTRLFTPEEMTTLITLLRRIHP